MVLVNVPVTQIGTEQDPAARLRHSWGSKIADLRKLRQLTRAELAERVDVSETAVGQWERGETAPRPHKQAAIARALDVPHAVLFPMEAA